MKTTGHLTYCCQITIENLQIDKQTSLGKIEEFGDIIFTITQANYKSVKFNGYKLCPATPFA